MLRSIDAETYQGAQAERERVVEFEYNDSGWDDLKVPGHWGMLNEFAGYTGKGWYRTLLNLPDHWKKSPSERVRLRFDAVYHIANVYLNGEYVGRHQGGFTPFEFDVTDLIDYGGRNILAVEADNSALVGATWNWGGIIRDVWLIKNSDVRIGHQYVHAEPDLETGAAAVRVRIRVENDSGESREVKVRAEIFGEKRIGKTEDSLLVKPHSIEDVILNTDLSASDVKLWHFDAPHLYHVESSLSEGGEIGHTRRDRFGIRKVEVTDDQLLLNGEAVRLGGFNRVSDHRYWGSSEPQEIIDLDVDLMKNAGANFMRIMHGTQNEKLIDRCDEKGILVIEEVNVRELTNPEFTYPEYPLAKQWLREMIERDCNHPSIIGWSVGNELRLHYRYVEETIEYVKSELDPYRLVSCVSNTGHRENETPENDPLGLSDLILQNCYMQTPEGMITPIHAKWPGKPMFFSEFGIGKFTTPSLDGDLPGLTDWYATIRGKNTFVIGGSLWTFNDYRSPYVQTLEDENRAWGLVNVWREKRRLYERLQRELSPVRDIVVEALDMEKGSASVKIPIRSADDFPSYSMRDYRLSWELRDESGSVLVEGSEHLPLLRPEDGEWTGNISWENSNPDAFDFRIRLLSANGYTRYERVLPFRVPNSPTITAIAEGKGSVRVIFSKAFGAAEHFLRYAGADGKVVETEPTWDHYIDIPDLASGRIYSAELIAVNEAGESAPSEAIEIRSGAGPLPPVIWHASIRDGKLIVGYSGEAGDEGYAIRYGVDKHSMNDVVSTNNRGMMTVGLGNMTEVNFQIKRTGVGGESEWSRIVGVSAPAD